ncbi:MAG: hypothetical protein EOP49_47770, partial [Sphingobacteriales bacterium]
MKKELTGWLKVALLGLSLLATFPVAAQQNKQDARDKGQRAIRMMDEEHKYDEAIRLLEESAKLDPSDITYPYEVAYAYYAQEKYAQAITQLIPLKSRPDVMARVYQLLGNSYDMNKQGSKAMEVYEEGLKKFPASGEIYLELGNMMAAAKNYSRAMEYFEGGIKADPAFPSNYYWAARLYLSSEEEVWGMLYGEIFMNLERNSRRNDEISKLLFNTYKSEISLTSDTSMGVSFSRNVIVLNSKKDIKKLRIPFSSIYETDLLMSILSEKAIDLSSLDRIRQGFISMYYSKDQAKDYPNALFDYEWRLKKAGHFEAYNYWLLRKGDDKAFEQWARNNGAKLQAFASWFKNNPLQLSKSNYFISSQY